MHITKPMISAFADESSESFDDQLKAVIRNGISHIELRKVDNTPIHKQSLSAVRDMKKLADDAGVKFSAVGSGLGKCPVDDDMKQHCETCRHLVEIAHILETPYIRMFSFHLPKDSKAEDYRQQVMDNMRDFIDIVSGSGIVLAHENESNIYGDVAERCLDLYQTFAATGCLTGIFDFANFIQVGQDPLTDCWPILKPYISYFHIKDARLEDGRVVPAGEGDGHIREILGEAIRNGFCSFLTLEPHLWPRYYGGTSETRFDLAAVTLQVLLKTIT